MLSLIVKKRKKEIIDTQLRNKMDNVEIHPIMLILFKDIKEGEEIKA